MHLDQYYKHLQKRKDKGDTPYNLRNCAYTEDFSRPKIVWKRVGSILRFCYDTSGSFALDSTCFATGDHVRYLVCFLNSKIGNYLLKDSPKTGTGDLLVSVQAIDPILAPIPNQEITDKANTLLDKLISGINTEPEINAMFYGILNFTEEEIDFIESQ